MAENAVAEDMAPLLVKDEIDNLNKEPEPEAALGTVVQDAGVKTKCFVFQRSTYYWTALIAQFAQVVLVTIAAAVSGFQPPVKGEDTTHATASFITSGLYSLFSFIAVLALVLPPKSLKRPLNAGRHVNVAGYCAFLNILNIGMIIKPAVDFDKYTDNILPVVVPLIFVFMIISALACIIASRITYKAAKRARGSDMVPDPDYRVPAWQLASPEESMGLSRESAIQLPS